MRVIGKIIIVFLAVNSCVFASVLDDLTRQTSPWYGLEKQEFGKIGMPGSPGIILSDSSHSFDVLHYRLNLNIPMNSSYFEGSMTMEFSVVDDSINQVTLDMVHLQAGSALVNGYPAGFSNTDSAITVNLNGYHYADDTLLLTIYYSDNTTNRGFYYFPRNGYTMAEPEDARWWFPCFDEPWDKATAEIYVTVPENYYAASVGYLESVYHNTGDHTKTWHWESDDPIATYLINLIILDDYAIWEDHYISGNGDTIPILNMVYAEDSAMAAYDFGNVPQMIEIFSELFGPYPFNKYGQGTVAPFGYGAMEHQTMTTMNRSWITGDRTVEPGYAHELAHMWWGDYVTLADWRHMWLNEGFATYSSGLFVEEFVNSDSFMALMMDWRDIYIEHGNTWGHAPIYDPTYLFSVRVYFKGAWVLHMLRGLVGDTDFINGLRNYASQFAYQNADTWDFINVMENASGDDLDWFFDEWVFGQAHPIYHYSWTYTGNGPYNVHLQIRQVQTAAPPFRMPITVRIYSAGDFFDFVIQNQAEFQTYNLNIDEEPVDLELDPDNWILKEVGELVTVEDKQELPLPDQVTLNRPFPNPFNSSINISFSVEGSPDNLDIEIFDILGRKVRDLASGLYETGEYVIRWNGENDYGKDLGSGTYFVILRQGELSQSQKITYLR